MRLTLQYTIHPPHRTTLTSTPTVDGIVSKGPHSRFYKACTPLKHTTIEAPVAPVVAAAMPTVATRIQDNDTVSRLKNVRRIEESDTTDDAEAPEGGCEAIQPASSTSLPIVDNEDARGALHKVKQQKVESLYDCEPEASVQEARKRLHYQVSSNS